jgi:hypothetical protein
MSHVLAKPREIVFSITDGAIQYGVRNPVSTRGDKIWARAGGKAVFNIENETSDPCEVRIPFDEFVPIAGAPAIPINQAASGEESVVVPPHDVAALVYTIKPVSHFEFSETKQACRYKYSVYSTNLHTGEPTVEDPDLEVTP